MSKPNHGSVERWVAMQTAGLIATNDEFPPVDDLRLRNEIYNAYLRVAANMARITFSALEYLGVDVDGIDWRAYQQALGAIEQQQLREKQAAFEMAHEGE